MVLSVDYFVWSVINVFRSVRNLYVLDLVERYREIFRSEFDERFIAFHKQLFASTECAFDDVTQHVYRPPVWRYQVDHSFYHDGTNWHLYYITGDMRDNDAYIQYRCKKQWAQAAAISIERHIGHAVGASLFDLKWTHDIELPSQGSFDDLTRSNGWVFKHAGRYGMLYGVRGSDGFIGFSLAWSDDLMNWTPQSIGNPVFGPPSWAKPGATCKDVHILYHDTTYYLYYITMDTQGYCCIALMTTTDWTSFRDEGCVLRAAPMLRGTMGIESPSVIHRNGIWHLFYTHGPGLWHAISPTPTSFVAQRDNVWAVGTGVYYMGPFHATEIVRDPQGQWWLTTDRKEQTRLLNRQAGRLCYRGSHEDEKTLEEGLYLSRIQWNGDQPILEMPDASNLRSVS